MINKVTKEILTTIFSDAELIDIDFSNWDKYISIVLVTDHYKSYYSENGFFRPVIELKFYEVTDISFKFSHHTINDILNEENEHFNWPIDQSFIEKSGAQYSIRLSQSGVFPQVFIKFKEVEVKELELEHITKVNPKWNSHSRSSALARPDIEQLYKILFNKTKK